MKTRITILLLFAAVCFGQRLEQDKAGVLGAWPQFSWYFLEYSETATYANIPIEDVVAGDTLVSKIYRTLPWQGLNLNISGQDSVRLRAELWQSNQESLATFKFVKSLIFHYGAEDSISTAKTVIDTAGYWWCNFGEGEIFTNDYFSLVKIFAKTGTTLDAGLDITGIFKGEILTR